MMNLNAKQKTLIGALIMIGGIFLTLPPLDFIMSFGGGFMLGYNLPDVIMEYKKSNDE